MTTLDQPGNGQPVLGKAFWNWSGCDQRRIWSSRGTAFPAPKLLDWLATEIIRMKWDTKEFIKLLVTSETYKQNSHVTNEILPPGIRKTVSLPVAPAFAYPRKWFAIRRYPVAGLLSSKMYGAPVRPRNPNWFESCLWEWDRLEDKYGEDRYRRGIYVTWRRSNPYPSMVTFDAHE
jgi:hypothetical protein